MAALFGQTSMLELLVEMGALVNAADHYGRTPLHLACMKGEQKSVGRGRAGGRERGEDERGRKGARKKKRRKLEEKKESKETKGKKRRLIMI